MHFSSINLTQNDILIAVQLSSVGFYNELKYSPSVGEVLVAQAGDLHASLAGLAEGELPAMPPSWTSPVTRLRASSAS